MNHHWNSGRARRALTMVNSVNNALEHGIVHALVRLRAWSNEDAAILYAQMQRLLTNEAKAAYERAPRVSRIVRWGWLVLWVRKAAQ